MQKAGDMGLLGLRTEERLTHAQGPRAEQQQGG
jgi:hypothetical protein